MAKKNAPNKTSNVVLAQNAASATPQVTTALAPPLGLRRPLTQMNVAKILAFRQ
jgi:hypothetical protein